MFQQITKGIKISVKPTFTGIVPYEQEQYYSFSYFITIENKSDEIVKLTERFWTIFDSLNKTEFVAGKGVIGQTPTLRPNDTYNYRSNCFLRSTVGAMKGSYKMINQKNQESFLVKIPTFQLTTTPILN